MKLSIISKDHKETWFEPLYMERGRWAKEQGLTYSYSFSGDEFGIDSDFTLFTEEPVELELAKELIEVGVLDVVEDEPIHNELEENDSAYTFKNECSNSICKIYIKTKTGQEHVLLYPER